MAYKKPENVAGLISNEDGRFLHDYAAGVPDGMCIVEIGPFTGKSTVFLAQGASDSVVVYTYDLWEDNHRPITGGGTQIVQDRTDSHKVFIDNIKKCGVNNKVFPAKYDSAKAGKEWPDDSMPIGLIYIDGDHRYPGVKADLDAWLPQVAQGAPIILDDYFSNRGVKRAVDELVNDDTNYWSIVDQTERFVVIQNNQEDPE